jgi:hypothetical protein
MEIGDLIKVVKLQQGKMTGIIISKPRRQYGIDCFDVLTADGQTVKGLPKPYIEVISESR